MAAYYFDNTSPIGTAGFGTLTGNWTDLKWSTSSAGTATSGIAWPGAGNEASFGGLSNTAVGGTLTASGTVNLDAITVQNLSTTTTQTLTGGTLSFGAVNAALNVGAAGSGNLTISSAITGTTGFTKSGAGALTVSPSSGTNAGLSGTVAITSGEMNVGTSLAASLSAVTAYSISAGAWLQPLNPGTNSTNATFTGAGAFYVYGSAATSNTTFSNASALSGMTGTTAPGANYATTGISQILNTANTGCVVTSSDLPATLGFDFRPGTAQVCSGTFNYSGSGHTAKNFYLNTSAAGSTGLTTSTFAINANGSGAVVIDTVFSRYGLYTALTATATLGGTSAAGINNTVSAPITNSAGGGVLAISKAGANKWILSGANTFTGGVSTVASGGTLVAKSGGATSGALGGVSGAVTIVSGTTLEIDGSVADIALTKSSATLTLGGTGVSSAGAIYNSAGTNTYTYASASLSAAATTIQVAAGTKLTMTGVIGQGAAGYALTKSGTGELALASANTFTGAMTIVGTVSATTLAAGGAASGIGQSTNAAANLLIGTSAIAGVLQHTGAAVASFDRNWTAGTAGAAIDASGSGTLTMTATAAPSFSSANTPATLTVQGSSGDGSTTFNTYSQPVSNNGTGIVGFTKAGSGAWKLTNATLNFTGDLTSSGTGFLDLNNTARSLSANIVASGGTLQNGSATVTPASSVAMSGGKITANLAGATKTLTVTGATIATVSELAPQATNNTGLTGGTANVNSGTLRLTAETSTISAGGGKVLGSMATTVASGAAIRTTTGTLQRGQMRYGGNLTFNPTAGAAAVLYIGG